MAGLVFPRLKFSAPALAKGLTSGQPSAYSGSHPQKENALLRLENLWCRDAPWSRALGRILMSQM
jgi:hypothetical protein